MNYTPHQKSRAIPSLNFHPLLLLCTRACRPLVPLSEPVNPNRKVELTKQAHQSAAIERLFDSQPFDNTSRYFRLTSEENLTLLIEEFGEPCTEGYFLPFPLTHAQIASAIGTTRVTVTRLMKELREERSHAFFCKLHE